MKRLLSHWLPVLAYCLLIFIQSSISTVGRLPLFPHADKLLHFSGYGLLGILFVRALEVHGIRYRTGLWLGLSILATSLYGLSDEIHQYFVPGRSADILDFTADTLGGAVGAVIWYYLRYHSSSHSR